MYQDIESQIDIKRYFKLVRRKPVRCSIVELGKQEARSYKKNANLATVRSDFLNNEQYHISTVLLPIDQNFSGVGEPIVFETAVIGRPDLNIIIRCSTWREALIQHREVKAAVEMIVKNNLAKRMAERWLI